MARSERTRQVTIGALVIAGVWGLFLLLVMATGLPGLAGEFFARIAAIVTTPFLMEASVIILGFILVLLINHWRRHREGDELVYLDEVEDAPKAMPDQARWAIYRDKPLDAGDPVPADLLEGAVAIGDHESAIEILDSMSDEERHRPEVMRQRIALAKATGKDELARRLEAELAELAGPL
jgi:ABC-type amino acid transport system permease subunit